MDTQRWELAGNIFERLLGSPREQRENLLDSLCGEDVELKHIVVSMLDSQGSGHDPERAFLTDTEESAPTNRQVGPWRLVSELGTGGMGVVWLAERADGQFEQRAALKLIKRGMDSDAVLKRFLRERQILARLTHPNIAHLLDGGIATDGRPYFAMEYVEGSPLMRYCHEHAANLETRIRLFLDVCNAVQFAHSHHVVHRDLKPSNVLVTANGAVKLLDFGIAKVLATDDSGVETITHLQRDRPMTPAYAAPEQIRGGEISEATDIYALGCVLYELLTGQRAYDFANAADAKDVLKIIDATDPVAPSRLKIPNAPVTLKRLRGDLDTIALTALKHDPARRYPSVAAFATDLRNYLTGKPISARRDSVFYRGYKFARRHRAGMAASLAVATIAVTAVVFEMRDRPFVSAISRGSAIAIVDFNNLTQRKDDEWIRAALEEELATELMAGGALRILPGEIVRPAHADLAPPEAGGYADASLNMLRKRLGADYVLSGSYLTSKEQQPGSVRLDLSLQNVRGGGGIKFSEEGALIELPNLVRKAGARLRLELGIEPGEGALQQVAKAQPATLDLSRHMGSALDALHKSDLVRARDELLDAVTLDPRYAPANALLAQVWKELGYDAKALASAQRAAADADALPPEQRLRIEREVASQKAEWPKVVDIDRKLLTLYPADLDVHLDLVGDLIDASQLDEAEKTLDQARKLPAAAGDPRLELRAARIADARGDRVAQAAHAQIALRQAQERDERAMVPRAKHNLATALYGLGRTGESEKYAHEAIDDYRRVGDSHGEADMHLMLAILRGQSGQPEAEQDEVQKALEIYQRSGSQRGIALVYRNLYGVLLSRGDRDGAERALKNALSILKETGDQKGQVGVLTELAELQMDEAVSDAALDALRQMVDLAEESGDRAQQIETLARYADGLRQQGSLDKAKAQCERAQAESATLGNPSSGINVDYACGSVALDAGHVTDAISMFERVKSAGNALNNVTYAVLADVALAQIEMKQSMWEPASGRLKKAVEKYVSDEDVVNEAKIQGLLALCQHYLNHPTERDAAAARSRELRSRITSRYDLFVVDATLNQLQGETGDPKRAAQALLAQADDAEQRNWLSDALETRLTALGLLARSHDPTADQLRRQIESSASKHGYGWVLARLSRKPT